MLSFVYRPHRKWNPLFIAFSLVMLAFLLRVWHIGDQELWFDEAFSFHMATIGDGLAYALRIENSPPLYYLLLRGWIKVSGTSEMAIRLLSAGFGTLFVGTAIAAGWRLFNPVAGLWSGIIAAISPIHIYYSQEARCYTLLTWALVLTYLLFWKALERDSWGAWWKVVLAATVSLYTHYLAIFALLPAFLLLWVHPGPQSWNRVGRALVAGSLCGFLLLPWVVYAFVLMPHPYEMSHYLASHWQKTPPSFAIPKTFEVFTLGPQAGFFPNLPKIFPFLEYPGPLRLAALGTLILLLVWISIPWADTRLGVPGLARRKAWLWALLLVPLGAIWAVSFAKPVYRVARYDMIAFPAYVLLLGLALAKLHMAGQGGRIMAMLAAILLLVPMTTKLFLYYRLSDVTYVVPSGKDTAKILSTSVSQGDVMAFNMMRGTTSLYYLNRLGFSWEGGECHNHGTGVRIACRIVPPEEEQSFGIPRDPLPVDSVARDLVFSLASPESSLWAVVDPQYLPDVLVLSALNGMDLKKRSIQVRLAPDIIQYRR
jgi:4-amino-4-deoxy-L-arabinose transferase-like glycosyltransferase